MGKCKLAFPDRASQNSRSNESVETVGGLLIAEMFAQKTKWTAGNVPDESGTGVTPAAPPHGPPADGLSLLPINRGH